MAGASTRDLKRRIRSVKNTSQLTRAMKLVSAAKLRRAQEQMLAARPYAHSLRRVIEEVARRVEPGRHPLLAVRELRKVELIVIAGDKGLCGSFNANILRAAENEWRRHTDAGREVELTLVGKKAVDHYRRRSAKVRERHQDVFRSMDYTFAVDLARGVEERFVDGLVDGVFLVFNEFKTTIAQRVVVQPLLPLAGLQKAEREEAAASEYLYEPSPERLLRGLLPRYLAFLVYHALLESIAAEHAARMTAMDSATRNADEMIAKLTLMMNRARQAAITTEIIEVVSGAQALG
ncbi:MAG: ATP synthase F1 subunit gamma [Acidobacteria bacterium]|nr:MAG: ATP synthase F1 subunit gamma [Acidobacteriota bacterium]